MDKAEILQYNQEQLAEMAYIMAERSKSTFCLITFDSYLGVTTIKKQIQENLPQYKFIDLDTKSEQITSLAVFIKNKLQNPQLLDNQIDNQDNITIVLNVFGLEMSLNPELIGQINIEREHLFRTFPCVIFLWLNEENTLRLRREAADFSSWITYDFKFYTTDDEREKIRFSGIDLKKALATITENKPLSISEIEKIKHKILNLEKELKNLERKKNTPRIRSEKFQVFKNLGDYYYVLPSYDNAIVFYSKALLLEPKNYLILNDLADVYNVINDKNKALKLYQKSTQINEKDNYLAFHNLSLIYKDLEEYENARIFSLKTINLNPKYFRAWFVLGIIYFELLEYKKSLECYEKSYSLHPNEMPLLAIATVYCGMKNFEKALEYALKSFEIKPKISTIHILAWCYLVLGNLDEAEKYVLVTVEKFEEPANFQNLGHIYFCRHNFPQALDYYKKSLALFENKELFFENMKNDYQYLVQYNVKQEDYENIQNELRAVM